MVVHRVDNEHIVTGEFELPRKINGDRKTAVCEEYVKGSVLVGVAFWKHCKIRF